MTPSPKLAGHCTGCGTVCYQIDEWFPDGRPAKVGLQLETGTQVEFVLSNGSEVAITFCRDCAVALTPADYPAIWRACAEATRDSLTRAGRRETEIQASYAALTPLWLVGRVRQRCESPEPGLLMVDRR